MLGIWFFQLIVFLTVLTLSAYGVGRYLTFVYSDALFENRFFRKWRRVDNFYHQVSGAVNSESYLTVIFQILIFLGLGGIWLWSLQVCQFWLPLNPNQLPNIPWDQALFNTVACLTNIGWYSADLKVNTSHLVNVFGFDLQSFLTCALSITVAVILIRSLIQDSKMELINFWSYFMRTLLLVILPAAILLAGFFLSQGVPNNYQNAVTATTLEGREQVITQGPIATHVGIKYLSGNGGGWFAAGAAHPYETPVPLVDNVISLAQLLLAAALPFLLGGLMGDTQRGWALYGAILILYLSVMLVIILCEKGGGAFFHQMGILDGVNLEGKEVRLGWFSSLLSAHNSVVSSSGASNCLLGVFSPKTYLALFANLVLGDLVFGNPGTGMINLLIYVFFTMYLISQMIGRSPKVYGKKLGRYELSWIMLVIFLPSCLILLMTAFSVFGISGRLGVHHITDVLYYWLSICRNNGSLLHSAFWQIRWINILSVSCALFCYLFTILPALLLAKRFGDQTAAPKTTQFPSGDGRFSLVLAGTIIIMSGLSFFPALVLGPILEFLGLGW